MAHVFQAGDVPGPVETRGSVVSVFGIRQVELGVDLSVADLRHRMIGRRQQGCAADHQRYRKSLPGHA
jgi:hypothetical protein